jgi:hypothetical protein
MLELAIIFWNIQLKDSDFLMYAFTGGCFKCQYANGVCDYAFK